MYSVDVKKRQISLIDEHELSKEEDAPMTIAVHHKVRRPRPLLLLSPRRLRMPLTQPT